jgi:quinol monooxygenase YgiN
MIVVIGRIRTDAQRREEFVCLGRTLVAASRAEPGCVHYALYEEVDADNDFVFVEEWESQEALERHLAMPHIAAFKQAVYPTLVAAPDTKFHTVASTLDLAEVDTGP